MTLSAKLDALALLEAAASRAPWQWLDSSGDPGDYDELQDGGGEMVASGFRDDLLSDMTDGRLCAALRNIAPELLAVVRAARWLEECHPPLERDGMCQPRQGIRAALEALESKL